MKLSNFNDVQKMVKMLNRLHDAIDQCAGHREDLSEEVEDCGGVPKIAVYGYDSALCRHKDGSGVVVDMSGCYVANEIAAATIDVLVAKKAEVEEWLTKHGVDITK